jgi:hypothetical protein
MFYVGIGIGIGRQRFAQGGASPSFNTTQWQLLNSINWENITDTWN